MLRLPHLAILWLATTLTAQVGFRDPEAMVPRRAGCAAADSASGDLYVIGGRADRVLDLWRIRGGLRTRLGEAPIHGGADALAYDPVRQRVVAVLRSDANQRHLWEFDGAGWTATVPLAGVDHQLLFDPVRQHLLLWSRPGLTSQGSLQRWDGTNLLPLGGSVSTGSLAFDEARGLVILAGHDVVHEWNGTNWAPRTATRPLMWSTQIVSDPTSGRAVMFGQDGTTGTRVAYAWTGQTWAAWSLAGMPDRAVPLLAGNRARQTLQLVGGTTTVAFTAVAHNDVFEFDGTGWQQVAPDTADPVFWTPRMCAIGPGAALLFDGGNNAGPVQTARFDQGVYTLLQPAHAPSPRQGFALAGDPATGRAWLFGGSGGSGPLADFWLWNGSDWQQLPGGPPARSRHGLCYDAVRDTVVLYGGTAGNDTWEFQQGQWQQRGTSFPPHVDQAHLVYDPLRRRSILVTYGLVGREVWEWDGQWWHSTNPVVRLGNVLGDLVAGYDPVRHQVVVVEPLASGTANHGTGTADTWDGSTWRRIATDSRLSRTTALCGVPGIGLVAQAGRDRYAVTLGHDFPAAVNSYGSPSHPTRRLTSDRNPWLGETYTLRYPTNVGLPGIFVTGFSATAAGSVPLPLDLGAYGMPGCQLLAAPDLLVARPWNNGAAEFAIALPLDPAFAGLRLYHQALMFGSPLSWASQGLEAQLGSLW